MSTESVLILLTMLFGILHSLNFLGRFVLKSTFLSARVKNFSAFVRTLKTQNVKELTGQLIPQILWSQSTKVMMTICA